MRIIMAKVIHSICIYICVLLCINHANAFTLNDALSTIEEGLGVQREPIVENVNEKVDQTPLDVKDDDKCSLKCSEEIARLKNNISELYLAFLALHSEFSHLSQHVHFHEHALQHAAFWSHQKGHTPQVQQQNFDSRQTNPHIAQTGEIDPFHGYSSHDSHVHSNSPPIEVSPNLPENETVTVQTTEQTVNKKIVGAFNMFKSYAEDLSKEINKFKDERFGGSGIREDPIFIPPSIPRTSPELSQESIIANENEMNSNSSVRNINEGSSSSHKHQHNSPFFPTLIDNEHFRKRLVKMEEDFQKWFKSVTRRNATLLDDIHLHDGVSNRPNHEMEAVHGIDSMETYSEDLIYATCEVKPNHHIALLNQQDVHGRINMWQRRNGPLGMHLKMKGFEVVNEQHHRTVRETILMPVEQDANENGRPPSIQRHSASHTHAIHIHEYGNLTRDCQSTGAHFNPHNMTHGGPLDAIKHNGDLGNIRCNERGEVDLEVTYRHISLTGVNSVVGRSIVIHAMPDDFGRNPDTPASLTSGNSGARIACCIIEEVKQLPQDLDSPSVLAALPVPKPSQETDEQQA